MNRNKLSAENIYEKLKEVDWGNSTGETMFKMAEIEFTVKKPDTIGLILQEWLKEYFDKNNIYYRENVDTQKFPDFYLSESNELNLLEVKSFKFSGNPAFNIANFDSYCRSISKKSFWLDTDYLIFGYVIDNKGKIKIKEIWLKKIWEITGLTKDQTLIVQKKDNKIYNIRPNLKFKNNKTVDFTNENDFVKALYFTYREQNGEKKLVNG